jgi:hypothetical protein
MLLLVLLVLLTLGLAPAAAAVMEDESQPSEPEAVTFTPEHAEVVAELPERRTEFSNEYELADGSRLVEVSLEPVNYRDSEGNWQRFDATLESADRPGYAHQNTRNAFTTYFSDEQGNRGRVRLEDGDLSLEFTPLGSADSAAQAGLPGRITKDGLEYQELFAETLARYTLAPGLLKEELTLASAKAPSVSRYRLRVSGLYPQTGEDGSFSFLDGEGRVRFVLRQPFATDSAPEAALINLSQVLKPEGDGYLYEMELPGKWLSDPARVFPVIVDPTVTTGSVAIDTFVSSLQPSTSFSSATWLACATNVLPPYGTCSTLIKFNLPTLPDVAQIEQAYISLYKTAGAGTEPVTASRIQQSWSSSVTWNTQPATYPPDSSSAMGGASAWYDFDITPSAIKWYLYGAQNYGTKLQSASSYGHGFNSSEAAGDLKPKLTIVYYPYYLEPRHTTYALGEFAGHVSEAVLDQGALRISVTDLAVASWGPAACLDRSYSSSTTSSSRSAPGWRFGFEQKMDLVSSSRADYIDERGEIHSFRYEGGSGQPRPGWWPRWNRPGTTSGTPTPVGYSPSRTGLPCGSTGSRTPARSLARPTATGTPSPTPGAPVLSPSPPPTASRSRWASTPLAK